MATPLYRPGDLLPARSTVSGVVWPAFTSEQDRARLAILAQLHHSERLPPEQLLERQLVQVSSVVQFAREQTRHYRKALRDLPEGLLDLDAYRQIPVLTRRTVRDRAARLHAAKLPDSHGTPGELRTSGSTGLPIVVKASPAYRAYWEAISLRDELWHRRDVSRPRAIIRIFKRGYAEAPQGVTASAKGSPLELLGPPGLLHQLQLTTPVPQQLAWLERCRPSHLVTQPSNLHALAQLAAERGSDLRIDTVLSISEVLHPDTRALAEHVFGARVADAYSAQELGYLALQCPEHGSLHVQSESVLLEVLRDDGTPCGVGEVGRVVATQLHNLAMPLIRYELGDYAEVGPPCPCGRTLPVLARVAGRVRNLMVLPDGSRRVPRFGSGKLVDKVPFVQHQFVQTHTGRIEARLVCERPLTASERQAVVDHLRDRLGDVQIVVVEVSDIPRGSGGKFEDFICQVDDGP